MFLPVRGLSLSLVDCICPSGGSDVGGAVIPPCRRRLALVAIALDTTVGVVAGEGSKTLLIRERNPTIQILVAVLAHFCFQRQ